MQGFFLDEPEMVEGRRVLLEEWDPADRFVLAHIANGQPVTGSPQNASEGSERELLILTTGTDGKWVLAAAPRGDEDQPLADARGTEQ
jgi:hypothetical protein